MSLSLSVCVCLCACVFIFVLVCHCLFQVGSSGDRVTEPWSGRWNRNKKPFLGAKPIPALFHLFQSSHFCLYMQIKPSWAFTGFRPKMGRTTLHCEQTLAFCEELQLNILEGKFFLTNGENGKKILNNIVDFLPLFDPNSPIVQQLHSLYFWLQWTEAKGILHVGPSSSIALGWVAVGALGQVVAQLED